VRAVCEEAEAAGVVEPANFNSPEQTVIAGSATGVQRALEIAKSRGAKRAMLLPMSAPSHCSLMAPAADRLRDRLAALHMQPPAIAVVNNVDVAAERSPDRIRDALLRQLCNPVRWVEGVRDLASRGVQQIVECGPGGVLTGLNKRITAEPKTVSLKDAAILRELVVQSRE
jgi:[acyl-carrier-protein] S-malonyltransferase